MLRRVASTGAIVVLVAMAILFAQNVAIGAYFRGLPRLAADFSPVYLQRELNRLASGPAQTLFLGDSVVWGYGVKPEQTAVAILRSHGCSCSNLAFKGGSPPNYYAMVRVIEAANVRPKGIVLEINQKVFSEGDSAYRKLHPGVAGLAEPLLRGERNALVLPASAAGIDARLDRTLSQASLLYAMRSDLRESLYGDPDGAVTAPAPAAALFQASYDLTPLSNANVGVRFLLETLSAAREARIPVVAFMTPTNHVMLHEFIDNADYRANGEFLKRLLVSHGARVVDLDGAFPAREFIDNDHLTSAGQRRLAAALEPALPH